MSRKTTCALLSMLCSSILFAQDEPEPGVTHQVRIAAGGVHEACMKLETGDALHYDFSSASELDFNVHYHVEEEIIFPVAEHAARAERNTMVAQLPQHFCLMWTHKGPGFADLTYMFTIE